MVEVPREQPLSFAQFVRKAREGSGLTLRSAAKKAGVSPSFLSDIELGYRMPSPAVLTKLAALLKVPESELLRFDPRPSITALTRTLETCPELAALLERIAGRYRDGEITYQDLVRLAR